MSGEQNAIWNKRLTKELMSLHQTPVPHLTFSRRDDPNNLIDVDIVPEEGTPYEGGRFQLLVTIPEQYPFLPPIVKMITKIYHPNIDESGRICLDILKSLPAGSWRPAFSIDTVINTVRLLLSAPNPADPLMPQIAQEYFYDKARYEATAREWTRKYATLTQGVVEE